MRTAREQREVLRRHDAGERAAAIARAMALPPGTVAAWIARSGRRRAAHRQAEMARVAQLRAEGRTWPEVAALLGVSVHTLISRTQAAKRRQAAPQEAAA